MLGPPLGTTAGRSRACMILDPRENKTSTKGDSSRWVDGAELEVVWLELPFQGSASQNTAPQKSVTSQGCLAGVRLGLLGACWVAAYSECRRIGRAQGIPLYRPSL